MDNLVTKMFTAMPLKDSSKSLLGFKGRALATAPQKNILGL